MFRFFISFLLILGPVLSIIESSRVPNNCTFKNLVNHHPDSDPRLKRLNQLISSGLSTGVRYSADDNIQGSEGYIYHIGICTYASTSYKFAEKEHIGALQQPKDKDVSAANVIGKYNQADFMSGTNWMMLRYDGGEKYHSHCGQESKSVTIMINCKQGEKVGVLRVLEEQRNKTSGCFYLFELDHEAACSSHEVRLVGLSIGSVLLIILAVVVTVYLVGGFLYQRFIVGAKGIEQFPNIAFWKDFGNLQADGCDFMFRWGSRPQSREYRGIGDDQLAAADDDDDFESSDRRTDDHLLPM